MYTDLAKGTRHQTQRKRLKSLDISFTQDKQLVLQTTSFYPDPTVPYRPGFWNLY